MTKDELIEINLELGLAHAVIGAEQLLLEIANGPIGEWDNGGRTLPQLRSEGLVARYVLEPEFCKAREAFETVRVDGGIRRDVLSNKSYYRAGFEIRNYAHAGAAGRTPPLLHGHKDEGGSAILELPAAA